MLLGLFSNRISNPSKKSIFPAARYCLCNKLHRLYLTSDVCPPFFPHLAHLFGLFGKLGGEVV